MTRPATRGEETCIFSVTIGREEDLAAVWQRACEIASSLELPGTEIGTTAFEAAAKLIADGHRGTVEFWLGEGSSSQVFFVRLNDTVKPSVQTVYSAMLPPEENSRLIQAVDLLSGAVAYETNSLHRAAKPAKHRLDLWSSILQASNLTTFAQPTTDRMNRFQILHFDFEKSAAKRFKPPPPPESDDE